MKKNGKLYGVSVGPGDPELITRKADSLLRRDAYWTYPVRNSKSDSYAMNIATRAGLAPPGDHCALIFPMTHDESKLGKFRQRAAEKVLEVLNTGLDVIFLVEGDASTYSTFGHLARHVTAMDSSITIETIAGVSSFNAAAARLQFPLTEVDDKMAVIPANYGIKTIDQLLDQFDTLVLMKVKPLLDDIIALLEQRGLTQHAAFIEKAGSLEERVVHDVSTLKGQTVNYLSLMLVKNPDRERGEILGGCRKKPLNSDNQGKDSDKKESVLNP
ncbi:MAG: precorrin-2 C(20)-methyltransferase [bacterium]|nr:precorrin-2 C(20)-methyltransferase [bacterium]